MNIAGQLYENQKIEAEKAIAEYRKKHKEQLLKYPTMVPVYDEKTKKVYCIFKPRNVDDLLDIMIGMSKKDVDRILKQYGYFEQRNYVYKELDLTETERKKKSTNPPESSDATSKLTESQKKTYLRWPNSSPSLLTLLLMYTYIYLTKKPQKITFIQ